jgi:hypothetical protein
VAKPNSQSISQKYRPFDLNFCSEKNGQNTDKSLNFDTISDHRLDAPELNLPTKPQV